MKYIKVLILLGCQDCHQEHLDPWTLCPSFYLGPAILFNIKSEEFTFYSACRHILTDSLVADPHLLGHKIKHFQTANISPEILVIFSVAGLFWESKVWVSGQFHFLQDKSDSI